MEKIQCTDYLTAISDWTGGQAPSKWIWNGRWGSAFGKNQRFRFFGHPTQKFCMVFDWTTQKKALFYVESLKGNFKMPEPPDIKNIEAEFQALEDTVTHPYAKQKGIDISGLGLKKMGNKLIIPLYSLLTDEIISWQWIDETGHKEFKRGCSLTGGVYFKIGQPTNEVVVCEGLATGCTDHAVTGKQVWCVFTKHNLDKTAKHLLQTKTKKVVVALDNDGPDNTHKVQIKDKRLGTVMPDKEGDFNDFQDDPEQKVKLLKAVNVPVYQKENDLDKEAIIKAIRNKLNAYYHFMPKTKIQHPEFWDSHQIVPKNNAWLICGGTGTGKTGHSLGFLKDILLEGVPCIIWEHSESNRLNRINVWIEKFGLRGKVVVTPDKKEVLDFIKKDRIIYIDDTDSFFQIKKPTDRREVADTLEDISWLCQLAECTMILAHYQTKTSRGELNIQQRSGGDMSWINKVRYAAIIEMSLQQEEIISKSGVPTLKTIEKSFLAIQKGYRPEAKHKHWWLDKDFLVESPIRTSTFQKILLKKLNSQTELVVVKLNKMLFDYMNTHKTNKMDLGTFYERLLSRLGLQKYQAWYYLNLSNYKIVYAVKGVVHKTYKEKASTPKVDKDDPGPVPF